MKISINCPSYKRPKVETLDYISSCKVWVDNKEYDSYIQANPGFEKNIIAVPDGIQGNVSRIRNYILDQELPDNDVVVLIDDDMTGLYHFEPSGVYGYNKIMYDESGLLEIIERYSELCKEFGFYAWGVNCNQDALSYMQYTPFSTVSVILGPFCAFLHGNECRYDESLPLKEDYDMFIQNCLKYRGVLRVNKMHYNCKQSKQKGGCATYRNHEREMQQLYALQKKWGGAIVKIDTTENHNTKKERAYMDYNPIIKIPIRGV